MPPKQQHIVPAKQQKIPPKKQKIPATLRNVVWVTHIGPQSTGLCFCCKVEQISKANFAVGHVLAEAHGGTLQVDNLRPVCTLCNSSMGKSNMHDFMERYGLGRKPAMSFGARMCPML